MAGHALVAVLILQEQDMVPHTLFMAPVHVKLIVCYQIAVRISIFSIGNAE